MTEANPPDLEPYELASLFYSDPLELGIFKHQAEVQCPIVYRQLLAHTAHMTVTVEKHHGQWVDVEVLKQSFTHDRYQRKILLRKKSDRLVVQFGIVRILLDVLSPAIRQEVLQGQTPLGRILIEQNVLRQVQLVALWQVECGRDLAEYFGVEEKTITYGRTARILVDFKPAIELLEVVSPQNT